MALRRRQKRWYRYTFDFYDQAVDPPAGADYVGYTRTYQGVPCLFESTPETDEPTPVGRNKEVNIFTMDKLHAPLTYDFGAGEVSIIVKDTTYVTMTAAPHTTPDVGAWWATQGGTRVHATTIGNKQVVYIKKSEAPALA